MSNREHQLISRIVRSGSLVEVIEWGITSDDFLVPETLAMWNHLVGYFSRPDTTGSVFGPEAFRQFYPTFVLCDDPSMSTDALCAEVRTQRIAVDINVGQQRIAELVKASPQDAATYMQALASRCIELSTSKNTDVFAGTAMDSILRTYELKESGVDMSMFPWPWDVLNEETGGMDPIEYLVLYGRPKSMKSWVLAFLIAWAYWHNKKVLIYTKEMTPENIFMRVFACIAQIEYRGLRLGKLPQEHKEALYDLKRTMKMLEMRENLICLSGLDAPKGADTVPWIHSKVAHYEPHLCAIDGMYLMSDHKKARSREERITNISRGIREMIIHQAKIGKPCPVAATFQATRGAAQHARGELDEIAYSDAIGQDTTLAMRCINDKKSPTILLVMAGLREFELNGFRINGVPATNFSFHSLLTAKEIEKAKEKDAEGEDNPEAHAKGAKGGNKVKTQDPQKALVDAQRQMKNLFRQ